MVSVTETKKSEASLDLSNQWYKGLIKQAPSSLAKSDDEGSQHMIADS